MRGRQICRLSRLERLFTPERAYIWFLEAHVRWAQTLNALAEIIGDDDVQGGRHKEDGVSPPHSRRHSHPSVLTCRGPLAT